MTQDYKGNLLKYLTGNLVLEETENEIIFENIVQKENNFETKIYSFMQEKGYSDYTLIDSIYSDTTSNYVLYGYFHRQDTDETVGMIVVMDDNFQVLNITDEYSSGVKLRPFKQLKYDESGYIYGIDDNYLAIGKDLRIILLNNLGLLTDGKYQVRLRNSYYFPEATTTITGRKYTINSQGNCISKIKNESIYIIPVTDRDNGTDGLLKFTLNVGSENEWTFYEYNNSSFGTSNYVDFIVSKDFNNNIIANISISDIIDNNNNIINSLYFDGSNINLINTINLGDDIPHSLLIVNPNLIYISTFQYIDDKKNLKILSLSDNSISTVVEQTIGSNSYYWYELKLNNNLVYTRLYDYQYQLTPIYLIHAGVIYNNKYYEQLFDSNEEPNNLFIVKNVYLLNQIIVQQGNSIYSSNFIINNIYNGKSYVDINVLIPNFSKLYSNGNILFARNLYNKLIQNNTTISSVEIPKNYLNNAVITESDLISETNLKMINDTTTFEKNMYEVVDINFINSLNIINRNNSSNEIINKEGSIRLNNSVSNLADYNDAKLCEYAILYYQDGSKKEVKYNFENEQDNSINIIVDIYIDKLVDRLELVSSDNLTVYQTIDLSNLILNKMYRINQKVEVV